MYNNIDSTNDHTTILSLQQQIQQLTNLVATHVSQPGGGGQLQPQQQTYQPTQQQYNTPNGQSYWDAPLYNVSLYKGKGGGKAKGKTRYGPPPADYTKPISWTCYGCNTDHNAESCWVCRNAFCRLPRPDPSANYNTNNQAWGGKGKGKGKGQGKGKDQQQHQQYNREAQLNTPAAQTLRDYCGEAKVKALWADQDDDDEEQEDEAEEHWRLYEDRCASHALS